MRRSPLGHQVHTVLVKRGPEAAIALAAEVGQPDLFDRVNAVASEQPSPSFLHSALCAMSLPVRRPAEDSTPIIRRDGQYTLVITPKAVIRPDDGPPRLHVLGVPYGSLPRLILIHIMTEAVRTRSRQIVLGATFTDWMRRMGYRTMSYGPRGSATLIRQQLDRLLACEWMIRWDGEGEHGEKEFGVKEIKLTTEYVGVDTRAGTFMREILLTEGFFEHLRRHAVPLNEHAIRQLRDSPTALDLYTWLAYRLPRISGKRPTQLSWQHLAVHFGNEGNNIRKFRQTVREAWDRHVSAVYPEAHAEFDSTVIRLHPSPAPLQQTRVQGARLSVVTPTDASGTESVQVPDDIPSRFMTALAESLGKPEARSWLTGVSLLKSGDEWQLVAPTPFKANWIRANFLKALEHASTVVELTRVPYVTSRPPT